MMPECCYFPQLTRCEKMASICEQAQYSTPTYRTQLHHSPSNSPQSQRLLYRISALSDRPNGSVSIGSVALLLSQPSLSSNHERASCPAYCTDGTRIGKGRVRPVSLKKPTRLNLRRTLHTACIIALTVSLARRLVSSAYSHRE